MAKLNPDFYLRPDVLLIARELIGKYLFTKFNGQLTGGIITETEAYEGVIDRASHAFGGRRTPRTEIMYHKGGVAYVYLCYGIHSLFNVVTNARDIPHAVLIRAIKPDTGINLMLQRRLKTKQDKTLTAGPGTLAQALGIRLAHTGIDLSGNKIWIEDKGLNIPNNKINITSRVGVESSKEAAGFPYRFVVHL